MKNTTVVKAQFCCISITHLQCFTTRYTLHYNKNTKSFFSPVNIWPAVFEGSISETEKHLFTLPTRTGGMGIRNPIETANNAYETSRTGTSVIVDAIKGKVPFSMLDHSNQFAKTISSMHCNIRHQDQATQDSIL